MYICTWCIFMGLGHNYTQVELHTTLTELGSKTRWSWNQAILTCGSRTPCFKYEQKRKLWNLDLLYQKLEFSPIFHEICNFQIGSTLWCHNYTAPWPIVMILVCMDRGDEATMVLNNTTLWASISKWLLTCHKKVLLESLNIPLKACKSEFSKWQIKGI